MTNGGTARRKVAFLDRDGTLNIDHGYVYRPDRWEFTPLAIEALALLKNMGFAIAVVSNQSGIARKFFTREDVERLHEFVNTKLACKSLSVDCFVYCPHGPDEDCGCRKPKTDLAAQVEKLLASSIDYRASWTIGDKVSDIEFGTALGTKTAIIRSRYWHMRDLEFQPDLIAASLFEACNKISECT